LAALFDAFALRTITANIVKFGLETVPHFLVKTTHIVFQSMAILAVCAKLDLWAKFVIKRSQNAR
jgi:hypothetical protein